MMRRALLSATFLALLASAAVAGDKEVKPQTLKAMGLEFTIKDSLEWKSQDLGSTVFFSAEGADIGVLIMESPLRDCGKVMARLSGNTPNKYGDRWFKTVVYKPGQGLTMCIDTHKTTYLATVTSAKELNDPVFKSLNNMMSGFGKALTR